MRQGRLLDLRSQARYGRRRVPCGRSRWACGRRWRAGPSQCVGGVGLAGSRPSASRALRQVAVDVRAQVTGRR